MVDLVDTHCHLAFTDSEEVVARARASGVIALVDVGIDVETSRACIERARVNSMIWASAGLHPNSCAGHADEMRDIAALARDDACVAVGETGLDLYRDAVPLEVQLASLEAHLALGRATAKPVIFHCRDAFSELFEALRHHAPVNGILHCFTGGPDEAAACLDLGLRLSFAGPLTYPKNERLREAARLVPADRMLVETDAPFLPPQSRRGKKNEPAAVLEVATRLAAARGVSLADVAAACTANSFDQFGVAGRSPDGSSPDVE